MLNDLDYNIAKEDNEFGRCEMSNMTEMKLRQKKIRKTACQFTSTRNGNSVLVLITFVIRQASNFCDWHTEMYSGYATSLYRYTDK